MNDLQIVNDIINESVKTTSYWSVIISSVVFIVYTLIIKVVDYYKSKDKDKPMIEMATAVKEVSNNVVKLNTVLDKMIQDNSKKDFTKCKNTIELSFVAFECEVFKCCREIIVHNNIDANKELILSNVSQKVNTEYYKIYSALSVFEIKDIVVSNHLHSEWIDEVSKAIIAIIYNEQEKASRINQVATKLKLMTNAYSTQVYNKTFN